MDWGWLDAVGHWAGNDGSTLVAGLAGAGVVLLTSLLADRRAEKVRALERVRHENEMANAQRREDIAAWRERRLDAFWSYMEKIDSLISRMQDMHLACSSPHPSIFFDPAAYEALRANLEDVSEQARVQGVRLRLLTSEEIAEKALSIRWDLYMAWGKIPAHLPSTATDTSDWWGEVSAISIRFKDLRSELTKQLGLPEDE